MNPLESLVLALCMSMSSTSVSIRCSIQTFSICTGIYAWLQEMHPAYASTIQTPAGLLLTCCDATDKLTSR